MKFKIGDVCKVVGNSNNYIGQYKKVKVMLIEELNEYSCLVLEDEDGEFFDKDFILSFKEKDLKLEKSNYDRLLD